MREINYWEQFLCSGKIADYLAYRGKEEEGRRERGCAGAFSHAGTGQCYRDDIESRAGRGI